MRKLAIYCASFSAAIFICSYYQSQWALVILACLIAAIGTFLYIRKRKKVIFAAGLCFGAGIILYSIFFGFTAARAQKYFGETLRIKCTVLDYSYEAEKYTRTEAVLDDGELSGFRIYLYDYSDGKITYTPGDCISVTVKIKNIKESDSAYLDNLYSKKVFLSGTVSGTPFIISHTEGARFVPNKIRHAIIDKIELIFDDGVSPFMKSLMLGDKSELYLNKKVYLSMSRAGFMHTVAVSGLHVSFIVSLFVLLLGHRRSFNIPIITVIWAFAFITGLTPSAVRAAIMQTVFLSAPLFSRESDGITSLFLALALILLFNPFAAASISLQMSFGAMAGIVFLSGDINRIIIDSVKSDRIKKIIRGPAGILASTVAVSVFTVPLCVIHFGYVSLLSFITNIFGLWAVSVCFAGGYILTAISALSLPAAVLTGKIVALFAKYIFFVCNLVASVPHSVLYISSAGDIILLAALYASVLLILLFIKDGLKKLTVSFALVTAAVILYVSGCELYYNSAKGYFAVLDVGQGQCIAAISGGRAVVVDCGGNKSTDAGEIAAAYLQSMGVSKIDALVLTHLDDDHVNGISSLAVLMDINTLVIPPNALLYDNYSVIEEICSENGIAVYMVCSAEALSVGSIKLTLYPPRDTQTGNENCMFINVDISDLDLLITGDADIDSENAFLEQYDIYGTEILVAGHHGSKYSSGYNLLSATGGKTAVISVGANYYGHPSEQALARLSDCGYNIYRTDESGTFEYRID